MTGNPYAYESNCSRERIEELFDCISPLENFPPELTRERFVEWEMKNADARYAVLIDGRLAGVAFVHDRDGWRELFFTKTEYLTTSRKLTFARTIPALFKDLDDHERVRIGRRGGGFTPMYMHTPEGDVRSEEWFVRAGCVKGEHGLRCPTRKEVC